MKKVHVLHISTAHPSNDPRLAYRVMPALADDYELTAIVPDGPINQTADVCYIRVPYYRRVLFRLFTSHPLVLWHTLRLRPSLLHIYDPELLPLARLVQILLGIPIVYEVHENFYKKMPGKIGRQGWLATHFFRWFDAMARRQFYLIFTEHAYLDTYTKLKKPAVVVYNYPSLTFLEPFRQPYAPSRTAPKFFYMGWLSFERAFDTLVAALVILKIQHPDFRVHLFGKQLFTDEEIAKLPGFDSIRANLIFHGYTDQHEAFRYAAGATAGLALLKPVGDYPDSYPTKLFEYMALGLPVLTSDFPLYWGIVERQRCGFCVSPYEPDQLAEALLYLIEHPAESGAMGERGRRAVETMYNWDTESTKLLAFYRLIFDAKRG